MVLGCRFTPECLGTLSGAGDNDDLTSQHRAPYLWRLRIHYERQYGGVASWYDIGTFLSAVVRLCPLYLGVRGVAPELVPPD